MRDWAIEYVKHVLEAKDWSANRLATAAGVATSTVARPLRNPDWPHDLSAKTIQKIADASGIDPTPFKPKGFRDPRDIYTPQPRTSAGRALAAMDRPDPAAAFAGNEIKIALVGSVAQIVATVDREGIAKLRKKLDAIESMLDD